MLQVAKNWRHLKCGWKMQWLHALYDKKMRDCRVHMEADNRCLCSCTKHICFCQFFSDGCVYANVRGFKNNYKAWYIFRHHWQHLAASRVISSIRPSVNCKVLFQKISKKLWSAGNSHISALVLITLHCFHHPKSPFRNTSLPYNHVEIWRGVFALCADNK